MSIRDLSGAVLERLGVTTTSVVEALENAVRNADTVSGQGTVLAAPSRWCCPATAGT
jgi:hypothetical protein